MNTTTDKVKILLSEGKTNKEISKILDIRPATAHYHIKKIESQDIKNLEFKNVDDWTVIQSYYDQGHNIKETISQFHISYITWSLAVSQKLIKLKENKFCIEDWLVNGREVGSSKLKPKLLELGILKNVCSMEGCGQLPEWNGKPLKLQLDHINGDPQDNRIENLRILCGHCHSQTETFCRGHKHKDKIKNFCECGKEIWPQSKQCRECNAKKCIKDPFNPARQRKFCECGALTSSKREICKGCAQPIDRAKIEGKNLPLADELTELVWKFPTTTIAKQYNVSDKAIEKRCKKFGIKKPPRGYWAKLESERKKIIQFNY